MFLEFFYNLRARGVPVTTHTWLAVVEALSRGLHGDSLDGFYQVARCLLIQSEAHYDDFDRVFAETFRGATPDLRAMLAELEEFLKDPKRLDDLDPALRDALRRMDLDELRRE